MSQDSRGGRKRQAPVLLPRLFFKFPILSTCPGLDFHEDLHRIGAKEGLKGRKLQKAMESYAWNITVLKVSARVYFPGGYTR